MTTTVVSPSSPTRTPAAAAATPAAATTKATFSPLSSLSLSSPSSLFTTPTKANGSSTGDNGSGVRSVATPQSQLLQQQRRPKGDARVLLPILLVSLLCLMSIVQWHSTTQQKQNASWALRTWESELEEPGVMTTTSTATTTTQLSAPLLSSSSSSLLFDQVALEAFQTAVQAQAQQQQQPRPLFNVETWNRRTSGGLNDADRLMLADYYRQANAVFEYGLGESTYIANEVGVPRYAGIDSDAAWVALARTNVSSHFRFYLADIGPTGAWGYAYAELDKQVYQYQLAPLISELQPFDVYMVDGRWRMACVMVAFLHASARGADPQHTVVLLHDCYYKGQTGFAHSLDRPLYRKADHLLKLVRHSGGQLCAYQRKSTTTDQDLVDFWHQIKGITQ